MSCQMIRAQDWDQRVESGRVEVRAPALAAEQELATLLARARETERELRRLLVQIQDRLAEAGAATAVDLGPRGRETLTDLGRRHCPGDVTRRDVEALHAS
jgi:phage shock protein A